jgi:hypothetical protein
MIARALKLQADNSVVTVAGVSLGTLADPPALGACGFPMVPSFSLEIGSTWFSGDSNPQPSTLFGQLIFTTVKFSHHRIDLDPYLRERLVFTPTYSSTQRPWSSSTTKLP